MSFATALQSGTWRAQQRVVLHRASASAATGQTGTYARAFALGAVGGMRSMLPLALLSAGLQGEDRPQQPVHALASGRTLLGLRLAAAGELVGDKLPFVPSRLQPAPLGARLAIGTVAGVARAQASAASPVAGGLLGGVGAGLGAWAGYTVRRTLVQSTRAPDFLFAILEDAAALLLGTWAARHA